MGGEYLPAKNCKGLYKGTETFVRRVERRAVFRNVARAGEDARLSTRIEVVRGCADRRSGERHVRDAECGSVSGNCGSDRQRGVRARSGGKDHLLELWSGEDQRISEPGGAGAGLPGQHPGGV